MSKWDDGDGVYCFQTRPDTPLAFPRESSTKAVGLKAAGVGFSVVARKLVGVGFRLRNSGVGFRVSNLSTGDTVGVEISSSLSTSAFGLKLAGVGFNVITLKVEGVGFKVTAGEASSTIVSACGLKFVGVG